MCEWDYASQRFHALRTGKWWWYSRRRNDTWHASNLITKTQNLPTNWLLWHLKRTHHKSTSSRSIGTIHRHTLPVAKTHTQSVWNTICLAYIQKYAYNLIGTSKKIPSALANDGHSCVRLFILYTFFVHCCWFPGSFQFNMETKPTIVHIPCRYCNNN